MHHLYVKRNAYYLYSRTSRRVPGKKYPQPVDTYIGVITKVLLELCPQGWKEPLGDEWKDVLTAIILKWSPESSLLWEHEPKEANEFHVSVSNNSYCWRTFHLTGQKEPLHPLWRYHHLRPLRRNEKGRIALQLQTQKQFGINKKICLQSASVRHNKGTSRLGVWQRMIDHFCADHGMISKYVFEMADSFYSYFSKV